MAPCTQAYDAPAGHAVRMSRIVRPGQLQHLHQAYIRQGTHWAEEKCYPADDRRGYTAFECLGCHDLELSRRRFNETGKARNERMRVWKRTHKACPKRLIEVFGAA